MWICIFEAKAKSFFVWRYEPFGYFWLILLALVLNLFGHQPSLQLFQCLSCEQVWEHTGLTQVCYISSSNSRDKWFSNSNNSSSSRQQPARWWWAVVGWGSSPLWLWSEATYLPDSVLSSSCSGCSSKGISSRLFFNRTVSSDSRYNRYCRSLLSK